MRTLRDESGFTLVELMVVMTITLVIVAALANVFTSGMTATSKANATLASQTNLIVAVNRLEFEARCASAASLVSGGVGVTLTLPTYCVNASGTFTWCVTSGALVKYNGLSCTGSGVGQTFATNVTSTTPFSCVTGGQFPRLQVALTSNAGTTTGTAASGTTVITLRNAATAGACS
jgi:prepilin-type N-terminal cleavage/methylation domain-containing protein